MSNTGMKIGSNRDINRDYKKLPGVSKKIVIPAVQHDPPHNLKMLTEKQNGVKTSHNSFDCRDWFNYLSFLIKINDIIIIHSLW